MSERPPSAQLIDRYGPWLAVAVPGVPAALDAIGTAAVIADGHRCVTECFGGAVLLFLGPTIRPLTIAGWGEAGPSGGLAMAWLFVGLALTLALFVAWWRIVGGLLSRYVADRGGTYGQWWSLLLTVVAAVVVVKFPIAAAESVNRWFGLLVEIFVWAVAGRTAWVLHRRQTSDIARKGSDAPH